MSDDQKALVPEVDGQLELPDTDITGENLKKVQEFIDKGLPDVIKVDESKMAKMVELYLSGSSYDKISMATRIDKTTIMFLSQKYGWCKARQQYLIELEENMKKRVLETNLVSQDFMLQLIQVWHKKIGKHMTRYLATDNEEHLDNIDLKELDRYIKVMESLKDSIRPPKVDSKAPAVGLNLGEGVTITKKGDNEVEITPKQRVVSDILQQYADARRQEEKNRK